MEEVDESVDAVENCRSGLGDVAGWPSVERGLEEYCISYRHGLVQV